MLRANNQSISLSSIFIASVHIGEYYIMQAWAMMKECPISYILWGNCKFSGRLWKRCYKTSETLLDHSHINKIHVYLSFLLNLPLSISLLIFTTFPLSLYLYFAFCNALCLPLHSVSFFSLLSPSRSISTPLWSSMLLCPPQKKMSVSTRRASIKRCG